MPHPSSRIVLKEAEIDIDIQPTVKWLNSFGKIFTSHSCIGAIEHGEKPNILFYCGKQHNLREMLGDAIFDAATIKTAPDEIIRYDLRFHSAQALHDFQEGRAMTRQEIPTKVAELKVLMGKLAQAAKDHRFIEEPCPLGTGLDHYDLSQALFGIGQFQWTCEFCGKEEYE